MDVRRFLNSADRIVSGNIRTDLARHNSLKVNAVLFAECRKNEELQQKYFKTRNVIITPTTNLNEFFAEAIQRVFNEMKNFEIPGSQWDLNRILSRGSIDIHHLEVDLIFLYLVFLTIRKLLSMYKIKKINVSCGLFYLHSIQQLKCTKSRYRRREHEFDEALMGIEFSVKLTDVSKFAKRTEMSINVPYISFR